MFNLRIIVFYATVVAIPIISAAEKDQIPESDKNINLYLVPPPGLKPFLPEHKETVYREPGIQYQQPVYSGYSVRSEQPGDEKIAIKVIQEDQKSYVVQPNYNDELGNRQSQPTLEFRNPEDPNTKYALEPEGPKQTKVTVKVIKEHKKTYAVDPSYIENQSVAPEYNKPEVIYKSIEPQYINSESVYKSSNPEYTKYELKADDDKEKNVFVKVLEGEKKTYVEDPQYHRDNSYYKPEYRKIENVYTDSAPRYKIPESEYNTYRINEEQPREKDIIVKVVKEDKNAFNVEPKYKQNIFEPEYNRQTVTEYRKPQPNYVSYEVNKEEPNILVKVVKENKKTFVTDDPQYKNKNSYLVPAYRKSTTEYEETASDHRHTESDHHKYEDHEDENKDKKVFINELKEDRKTYLVEPKYKSGKSSQEPVYQKSVTEYRNSEPEYRRSENDYHKYGENEREIKVYVKEDKKNNIDSKHKNDDAYFEPEYRKSVTDYEKSQPEYRSDDSGYHKYEVKDDAPKEKDVYVKVTKEDRKTFVDSKYKNYDSDFEPENRKSDDSSYHKYEVKDDESKEKDVYVKDTKEDKKTFVDSKYNNYDHGFESENRKSDDSGYHKYEVQHNEHKEIKDKNTYVVEDSKYNSDNTYFKPQYRKSISEYEKSEPDYKKSQSNYDKYEVKNEKHQEKDIYVTDTDKNHEDDNGYNGSEYRKSESEYKPSESDHDSYDDHDETHKEEKELVKNARDTFDTDLKYKHEDTRRDSDYKKYEKEYKDSEPKSNSGEDKHDVLIKIWSNKS